MRKYNLVLLLLTVSLIVVSPSYADMMFTASAPDSGLAGFSFIEIAHGEGITAVASGDGVSISDDNGQTWVTYTNESGLTTNTPSAVFIRDGRLWIAGSHTEYFNGLGYPFGDGFDVATLGDISNLDWANVVPGDSSSYGYAKLAYDIDGTDSAIYAATFHSGFIVSFDFGQTWEHMFFSQADSLDWVADSWADLTSGRYYSCAVDTFHSDTLIVLGGTAGGIAKYYYLPRRNRLAGKEFYDFARNDTTLYIATYDGLTRTVDSSYQIFYTSDTTNGLPYNWTRKVFYYKDKLWVGVFNPADTSGAGLFYSSDSAESWQKVGVNYFNGPGSGVYDVNYDQDSVIYVAAGDSGLFRSNDDGQTWGRVFVDPGDILLTSPRNQVYSVDIGLDETGYYDDSLYLGTRGGLVKASFDNLFNFTYDTLIEFPEDDSCGSFITKVRHQNKSGDSIPTFTWVATAPQGAGASSAIIIDSFNNQVVVFVGYAVNDLEPVYLPTSPPEMATLLATDVGLYYNPNIADRSYTFKDTVVDFANGLILNNNRFLSTEFLDGRVYAGSDGGGGLRMEYKNWSLVGANTDPRKHDLGTSHTYENSGLGGDWVVALEVQKAATDTVYWAACRRVLVEGENQMNCLSFSTDFGASWTNVLPGKQIWNIDFDSNDVVYAAASEGLYYSLPPWTEWKRANIIDPAVADTIVDATKIYSVRVIDSTLWVGTSLGLAVRNIHDVIGWQDDDWDITRVFKDIKTNDEVYAAPVPYSPIANNGRLSIHYHVDVATDVTVKIYDFAMNLVRVVAENKPRAGGSDYYETWDGYNGAGDRAATGIYYFKVTFSSGEEYWGRLAIIP